MPMTPFDTNGAELVPDYSEPRSNHLIRIGLITLFIGCTVAAWRWL